jgi:hypothetical protein
MFNIFLKDIGSCWQIYIDFNGKKQIPFCSHVHYIHPGNIDVFNPCPMCKEEHRPTTQELELIGTNFNSQLQQPITSETRTLDPAQTCEKSSKINTFPSLSRNRVLQHLILSNPTTGTENGVKKRLFNTYIIEVNGCFRMNIEPFKFDLSDLNKRFALIDDAYHYPYVPDEIEIPISWRSWTANFIFNVEQGYIYPSSRCNKDVFSVMKVDKTILDPFSPNLDYCDMRNCPVDVFIGLLSLGECVTINLVSDKFIKRTVFLINPQQLEKVRLFYLNNEVLEEIEEGVGRKKITVRRIKDINGMEQSCSNRVFTFHLILPYTSDIKHLCTPTPSSSQLCYNESLPPILRDRNTDKTTLLQAFLYVVYFLRTETSSNDVTSTGRRSKDTRIPKPAYVLPEYYPQCDLLQNLYLEINENWTASHEELSDVIKYAYTMSGSFNGPHPYNDVTLGDIEVILRNEFYCFTNDRQTVRDGNCYPSLGFQETKVVVRNISQFILCFYNGDRSFFKDDVLYVLSQENVFVPKLTGKGFNIDKVNFVTNDHDKLCYMKYLIQKVAEVKKLKSFSFDFEKEVKNINLDSFSERDRFYLKNHWL